MEKNKQIAEDVLLNIGGKENVISVFHCATRLRFELKDFKKVDEDAIKNINGILGIKKMGKSFQVIIGPNVGAIYTILCEKGQFTQKDEIKENLDIYEDEKIKFSLKNGFNNVITYVMNSMAPIIPVLIGVSIWKTIGALMGPSMLNVIPETSDFYITCNFVFEALFYFLPIFIGYTAAKNLRIDPVWGIFLGALIITPSFAGMAGIETSFSVFGISVPVANYAQQFLPVLLGVWILKYVNKLLTKIIPTVISSLLVPIIVVAIMSIIMFAICAPIGSFVGEIFSAVFMYCGNAAAPIKIFAMILLTALVPIMILFGMHVAIYVAALTAGSVVGYEGFFFPCMVISSFVLYGMSLGAIVKFKKDKGAPVSYSISGFIAGITEPSLYGVCLKSKSSVLVMVVCCAIGGLLAGLFNLKCSLLASVSILSLIPFFTVGEMSNMIFGVAITLGTSLLAAVGVIFFAKYDEKVEKIKMKEEK